MEQVGRRVTIADVAEKAGVSKTAVSFAFNNPERDGFAEAFALAEIQRHAALADFATAKRGQRTTAIIAAVALREIRAASAAQTLRHKSAAIPL